MAKSDSPKKRKPKTGVGVATGAGLGVMSAANKTKAAFTPYNKEFSYRKGTVPRTVASPFGQGTFVDTATQRVSTNKAFSKLGVVTQSTLTETYDTSSFQKMRRSSRTTTLSPRGKLKGIGQIVIQETKAMEKPGRNYRQKSGKIAEQGGKGKQSGKYKTKSITYAKEGYPTPKRGRVPKAGNPVVSKLNTVTNLTGKMVSYTDDYGQKTVIAETKNKNIYKNIVKSNSKAGNYIQSKSAKQLATTASRVGKAAGKIIGAGNIVGSAIMAYDAYKFGEQWRKDNKELLNQEYTNYSYNK
tara:strand:+ start:957 stop:1853 length:897 start_codon:yes stop_codon:yes gene_type:complete